VPSAYEKEQRQRGAKRMAPSSRIAQPFSMEFSQIWIASMAYSAGLPSRDGKGT
jgi:hypothetical protein